MISYASIQKYRKLYPNDICAYSEPGDSVLISNKDTGDSFISPDDETDDIFLERIEKSSEIGKNLFYEEWKRFEYEKESIY